MLILIFPVRLSPRNFSIDAVRRRGTTQFATSKRTIGSAVSVAIRGIFVAEFAFIFLFRFRGPVQVRQERYLALGGRGSPRAEMRLCNRCRAVASRFRRRLRPGLPASEAMSALARFSSASPPTPDIPRPTLDFRFDPTETFPGINLGA